ncbi:MAG: hypothetical protein Q7W54_06655 [Bacteroidota bacterium]|nr:hypothetical protein [Bacteroidota bacterium]
METNKILLGGLAGGVAFFLLGWLIYGILLMDYSMANFNQCNVRPMEDMVWWAMILANLTSGLLFALIFSWSNTTGILNGAKVGGIIGLLFAVSIDLSFYAMTTTFLKASAILVDIVAYTVMSAIAGAVIAWVMGMKK